ncbi:MAG: YHYH domain-containing protein [Clostridium sp.]
MKKPLAVLITAFSLSLGLTPAFTGISGNLIIEAEAHQGRTDANGGHHDYKNKSGLGSYHYHCGGNPAHLHQTGLPLCRRFFW